jgi:phosphoribosyl 1,2-cyclic phosphate phosphodiesterase
MIGCSCAVCRSDDPRDKRSRPSIYLEVEQGPSVLVDTSTDLRQQALARGVGRVDAILFTHSHADHIMGLDDVRRFNQMQKSAIPAYADPATATALKRAFFYIFDPATEKGGGLPQIVLNEVDGPFAIAGLAVQPVPLIHGARPILGYRFGNFAYLTDCNRIPEETWALLEGVEIMILDALRHRWHPTHFSVAEALQVVERVKPRHTYFTHICHDLPHVATNASLPAGVELAYDGLVLTIDAGPSSLGRNESSYGEASPKRPPVA